MRNAYITYNLSLCYILKRIHDFSLSISEIWMWELSRLQSVAHRRDMNTRKYIRSKIFRIEIPTSRTSSYSAAPLRRVSLVRFFSSSLNSIVIYVSVSSRADVAFLARRSQSSLKEYPSCLFLRTAGREAGASTYSEEREKEREPPRSLESPRGWWRCRGAYRPGKIWSKYHKKKRWTK